MANTTNFKSIEVAPAIIRSITTDSDEVNQTNVEVKWTPVAQVSEWTWMIFRHESSVPGDIFVSNSTSGKRTSTIIVPRGQSLPGMLIAPGTEIHAFSSIESRLLQVISTPIPVEELMGKFTSMLAGAICDTLTRRR